MVEDIEELEEMDASEIHARRLKVKEVLKPQRSGNFIFPVEDGTVKILGKTASENIHFSPGSSGTRRRTFKENQMNYIHSPTYFMKTQLVMMRKRKMTSGLLQESSFIVITLNPQSNCTCREKKHFLFR